VVTIDRYNERTRYKLWFDDEVFTYLTDQYSADKTAGARMAMQQRDGEKNTYGCVPFAFLHYRAPVRQFWTPGPGTFLRKAELRIIEAAAHSARGNDSSPRVVSRHHVHSRPRPRRRECMGLAPDAEKRRCCLRLLLPYRSSLSCCSPSNSSSGGSISLGLAEDKRFAEQRRVDLIEHAARCHRSDTKELDLPSLEA